MKKLFENESFMEFIIVLIFIIVGVFCIPTIISAQNVVKQGNTFVQQKKTRTSVPGKKTQYTYKTTDGKEYPIYLSAKGKAYIIRVSKKSGKEYKQYLPKITEQLNGKNK